MTLLNSSHGSAHDAQKLRTDTRFKSADSNSLKCSGDDTSTRFVDTMVVYAVNMVLIRSSFSQLLNAFTEIECISTTLSLSLILRMQIDNGSARHAQNEIL
jgi:hypothetical protein